MYKKEGEKKHDGIAPQMPFFTVVLKNTVNLYIWYLTSQKIPMMQSEKGITVMYCKEN